MYTFKHKIWHFHFRQVLHTQTCFIISSSQVWILEPCPSSVPTIYFKIFHPFNDFYKPKSDRIIESWTRLGHTNITVNFLPTYLIHLDKWNQLACGQLLWQMNSPQSVRHKAAAVYQSPTEVRFYLKENIYSNIGFTVLKICCIRIKIHRHYNLACNRVR